MVDRPTFNEMIKDVLGNLYDATAIETHPTLFSVIKMPAGYNGSKGEYIRQLVLDAIEQLRPLRKEESINSPEWRPYYIVYKRYVEGMGLQELSDALAVSSRQLRRDHHRALEALYEILWMTCFPDAENEPSKPEEPTRIVEVHNEIIDAFETTQGVYKMLKHRFDEKGIAVAIEAAEPGALVITDRVILRQALIGIFNESLLTQKENQLNITLSSSSELVEIQMIMEISPSWETAAEEDDDDLAAVRYWCQFINARLEEKVIHEKNRHQIRWTLKLPHSNQRILLVIDDQPTVLSLFKRYLSQSSILPVGVENPQQALTLAHQLHPALITLDVMMPQIDGWELLQTLKLDPQVREIPIIVCSAWDDPDLSRNLGAAAFLKKPVTQKMLLDSIHQLIPES